MYRVEKESANSVRLFNNLNELGNFLYVNNKKKSPHQGSFITRNFNRLQANRNP